MVNRIILRLPLLNRDCVKIGGVQITATIAASAEKNGVKPPAVIVIGDVVKLYNPDNPDLIPVDGISL